MTGRFAVFGGNEYYPHGGWADFVSFADTLDAAMSLVMALEPNNEWSHIVDISTGKVVKQARFTLLGEVLWRDGEEL